MRLKEGDAAPGFTLESVNMGSVSLESYRGGVVLLVFGRYFGCPVCQLDFDRLLSVQGRVIENAELVYLVQSSPESAAAFIEDRKVEFPVVPVPKEGGRYRVYDDYGIGRMSIGTLATVLKRSRDAKKAGKAHGPYEGVETQSPADFIVNGEGVITHAHYGLFEPEEVLSFLGQISRPL
ncbi:redoxin domain-containing protein [Candidatus Bathyarchaeota archaeon]|nr:redoxin domain-containing protein [Candidatus Bathyarchaeota archaeon]